MVLNGLSEYLDENYNRSIFDLASGTGDRYIFHLHPRRVVAAAVAENMKYDLLLDTGDTGVETVAKTGIKFLYRARHHDTVTGQMRIDNRIMRMELRPILSPTKRNHIKNKSLYPLMKERKVLFVTMLEGEVLRGIIGGFSRYEIALLMRGGLAVTLLRHGIHDIRDKDRQSYLKQVQQTARQWKNSPLYTGES